MALAQFHLVASSLLFIVTLLALRGAAASTSKSGRTQDGLGTIFHELFLAPAIAALHTAIAMFVMMMCLLLHIMSWGLLLRRRWGHVGTMAVCAMLALPLAPAVIVTLIPGNWSIATLMFNSIVLHSVCVFLFLMLRPVRDAIWLREQEKPQVHDSTPRAVVARGRAERARTRR